MGRIVWLASYPRSGNTWVRSLITSYLNPQLASPLDDLVVRTSANERALVDMMMGFETADLLEDEVQALRPLAFERLSDRSGERVYLKVHDACGTVPGGMPLFTAAATDRAVYVVRDPRDVCVSLAHFGPGRSVDRALEILLDSERWLARGGGGRGDPLPQRLGSWPDHVRSWRIAPAFPVHTVRYEDLLERPRPTLSALIDFLDWPIDAAAIDRTLDSCRFDRLAAREAERGFGEVAPGPTAFFRAGRRGGWRDALSEVQASRIDATCGDLMRELGYLEPAT
ncbi:MAG: sulfotransferase domain-containing protein [Acidobacteriota bacterium]